MRSSIRGSIRALALLAPVVSMSPALLAQAAGDPPKADAPKADAPSTETPKAADEKKVEVVDFRKLKELLPATLGGLKRTEASGERTALDKFVMSQANGDYGEGEKTLSLQLIDYGVGNPMLDAIKAMAGVEIDRETDKEYEKSVRIEGHPGLERYNAEDKNGTLTLYVAGRFVIELDANGMSKEEFQKAARELPVKKLAELK